MLPAVVFSILLKFEFKSRTRVQGMDERGGEEWSGRTEEGATLPKLEMVLVPQVKWSYMFLLRKVIITRNVAPSKSYYNIDCRC